jgi:hypothetical protein
MKFIFIKKSENFKKKISTKHNTAKFFFYRKVIFYPKFFFRVLGVVLDNKKNIITNWNYNKSLSNWSFTKILSFRIFDYDFFLNKNLLFLANFFRKKKEIYLDDNDIALFGAWPHIYWHKLVDFVLRINFLKNKKYKKIFLPIFLKKILESDPYKKIFSKLNFSYYEYDKKIIFHNLRYISSLNHYRNNFFLKKNIYNLKYSIKNRFNLKSHKYRYSLISRNKSTRPLDNEDILFSRLKKYKFKRFFFEKLTLLEQIKICYNSKIVIGVQGSGLANLIFMQKKANLIQLSNIYINNPNVRELCAACDVNFYDINFLVNNKDFTGSINVNAVEKKVHDILSGTI